MSTHTPIPISPQDWIDALQESTDEFAKVALEWEGARLLDGEDEDAFHLQGGYVGLVGDECAVQLGLASSPEGCQQLAKALLMMAPEEPDLPLDDIADGMCEISNIVAGGVKDRIAKRNHELKLGLPLFFPGSLKLAGNQECTVAAIVVGDVPCHLAVIHSRA